MALVLISLPLHREEILRRSLSAELWAHILSMLWNLSKKYYPMSTHLHTPTLQLQRFTYISQNLFKRKNNSASQNNSPSKEFFSLLPLKTCHFLIWLSLCMLAVLESKVEVWGRFSEAVSLVSVHSALIVLQVLLWTAYCHPCIKGLEKSRDKGVL